MIPIDADDLPDGHPIKMMIMSMSGGPGKAPEDQHQATVPAHYGVKDKEYDSQVEEMLLELLSIDDVPAVLDKHFKKCSGETRSKIHAYAAAYYKMRVIHKIRAEQRL